MRFFSFSPSNVNPLERVSIITQECKARAINKYPQ